MISVTEQGQGTETVIGQIIADQLGVERERVKVTTGDTEITPDGWIVEVATGQQRISLAELARIAYFRSDTLPP